MDSLPKGAISNSYLRELSRYLPWKSFNIFLLLPSCVLRLIDTFSPLHHGDHFLLSQTILEASRGERGID